MLVVSIRFLCTRPTSPHPGDHGVSFIALGTTLRGRSDQRFDPSRSVLDTSESLAKGARCIVVGRLRTRSWETAEGEKRSVTEIEADELGPSLKFATAKVERASRDSGSKDSKGGDFNDEPPF